MEDEMNNLTTQSILMFCQSYDSNHDCSSMEMITKLNDLAPNL